MSASWLFRLEWGDHPITAGRFIYLLRTKFAHGLRAAYYRDGVRPLILAASPVDLPVERHCEIHVLTSGDDWLNLMWTLRSFQKNAERNFAICIHDDGTLSPDALAQLGAAFPAARIISRAEADARVAQVLAPYPRSLRFRLTNKLSLKLFDFAAFLEAERMLVLDSDVLFFAKPDAVLAAIDDATFVKNTLNKDWREGYTIDLAATRPLLDFDCPPLINAGFGVVQRGSLRLDWIEEFLALPGILSHPHQIEQTLIALCSARFGFEMLPPEYNVQPGPRKPGAPSRHYAGPMRPLMYREGMRDLVGKGFLTR